MKKHIKRFLLTTLILFALEVGIFLITLTQVMTDEPLGSAGLFWGKIFHYGCGFPLVLLNEKLPFDLTNGNAITSFILPVLVNLLLQALIVTLFWWLANRLFSSSGPTPPVTSSGPKGREKSKPPETPPTKPIRNRFN